MRRQTLLLLVALVALIAVEAHLQPTKRAPWPADAPERVPIEALRLNVAGLPFTMKPFGSELKTMPVGLAVVTPETAWGGAMVTTSGSAATAFVLGSQINGHLRIASERAFSVLNLVVESPPATDTPVDYSRDESRHIDLTVNRHHTSA